MWQYANSTTTILLCSFLVKQITVFFIFQEKPRPSDRPNYHPEPEGGIGSGPEVPGSHKNRKVHLPDLLQERLLHRLRQGLN